MKKSISERLQELMDFYELKQTDICNKVGIQKSAMSNYMKGTREPRQNVITAIAVAYNIDEVWLMGYDVPMKKDFSAESAEKDFELIEKFSRLNDRDKKIVIDMIDSMIGGN